MHTSPTLQSELQQGNDAGREHYRNVGQMLIEAKAQVMAGQWSRWLTKNFELSQSTANTYMRWARENDQIEGAPAFKTLREMTGHTARDQSKTQQAFRRVLRDISRDNFIQERQDRDKEQKLHRDLAVELVDLGYRALATKLHPDRGGSKDAMVRLNRVRQLESRP
jgi:hypothetical protein